MKKTMIIAFIFLILTGGIGSLRAAYIVQKTYIFTARVNISGYTNTALVADIFTRLGNAPDSMVTWTNISVPISGGTKWKVGNHYVRVTFTNFLPPWGISIATMNTNTAIAKPRLTGSPQIGGVLVGSNTPSSGLLMAWQIQPDTTAYQPPKITDPILVMGSLEFTNTGWGWKFMSDQAASSFTNLSNNAGTVGTSPISYYSIPLYNGNRLWGASAPERAPSTSPVYIYLAADFTAASIQIFKTTALTLEMYKP